MAIFSGRITHVKKWVSCVSNYWWVCLHCGHFHLANFSSRQLRFFDPFPLKFWSHKNGILVWHQTSILFYFISLQNVSRHRTVSASCFERAAWIAFARKTQDLLKEYRMLCVQISVFTRYTNRSAWGILLQPLLQLLVRKFSIHFWSLSECQLVDSSLGVLNDKKEKFCILDIGSVI